jgi:hypothetical protein
MNFLKKNKKYITLLFIALFIIPNILQLLFGLENHVGAFHCFNQSDY